MSGSHLIDNPTKADGARLWRIARDSGTLDLNSPYAYLLWCRDFAATSAVVRPNSAGPATGADASADPAAAVGFVIGYRRPDAPEVAVVWQIAVDAAQRGKGLAAALLDGLFDRLTTAGVTRLETTITPDNAASIALFTAFAKRWGTDLIRTPLFSRADFPGSDDEHEPEDLYRSGPLIRPV